MKNNKLLIIIIIVLALALIGVGVTLTLNGKSSGNTNSDKKEYKMNDVHTKDGVKVTSFSVKKVETEDGDALKYNVSVTIVNETGKDIVSGKIDFKLLCENGEKREYTATFNNLENGKSMDYSKDTTFDLTDFYDYEMEVTTSDILAPMGY